MDGAVTRIFRHDITLPNGVLGDLLATSNPRLFEGVPGRIASGVFLLEVSLALVGVASPAYFQ
jgi:hypothetical protein